jgi:hypothetical protein
MEKKDQDESESGDEVRGARCERRKMGYVTSK